MMRSPQLLRPPPRLPAPPVRLLPRRAHRRAPASMRTIATGLGITQGAMSGCRCGRYLRPDRASLGAIAEILAPTKTKAKTIRRQLLRRWIADLLDAHLRGADVTPAEARRAIDNLGAILTHRLIGAGGETRLQTTARHPVTSGHPQSATIAGMDQDGCGLRPGRALRRYLAPPAAPRRARPLRSRTRPVRETR